jgi:mRNA-degrading endonuclease toxin of MazEF toxin-antitoxin module
VKRGEIWHVDLNPVAGREQQGKRYVLIVSADALNRLTGMPVVLPITTVGNAARYAGFAVNLQGAGTGVTGVIQCEQPRTVDLRARGGRYSGEAVPDFILDEVLGKLAALFE